jgi:ADP-ribose pyrophosphatase YjhB (NUDIX family)
LSVAERPRITRPILAASVAVIRDGRLLVATRTKPPSDGLFSLPGGRVEAGETLEQAALRELGEEVGVAASILGFNDHVEVIARAPNGELLLHYVVASFVAAWISGEGTPGPEAGEVRWIAPDEIAALRTTAGLPKIAARAFRLFEAHKLAGKVRREQM